MAERVFRTIGQTKNLIVHILIILNTFEEKIDEIIKKKKDLSELTIAAGENWLTELSDRALKKIFSLSSK